MCEHSTYGFDANGGHNFYAHDHPTNQLHTARIPVVCQGSKGIRQRPINLCTPPMMIYKITPSLNYNTQLSESTNLNLIKVPKVAKPTNKNTLTLSTVL